MKIIKNVSPAASPLMKTEVQIRLYHFISMNTTFKNHKESQKITKTLLNNVMMTLVREAESPARERSSLLDSGLYHRMSRFRQKISSEVKLEDVSAAPSPHRRTGAWKRWEADVKRDTFRTLGQILSVKTEKNI